MPYLHLLCHVFFTSNGLMQTYRFNLEEIRRSKNGERKITWVSWDVLTMSKYMGGLGFRDTKLFNLATVAKQSRDFYKSHSR